MLQQIEEKVKAKFVDYYDWNDIFHLKLLWLMLGLTVAKKVIQYLDTKM